MALLAALLVVFLVSSALARSKNEVRKFRSVHPCPATGNKTGACPGLAVDHIKPLCVGGADRPRNMQWLSVVDHKIKTRTDRRRCRAKSAAKPWQSEFLPPD